MTRGGEGPIEVHVHPRVAEVLIESAGELITGLEARHGRSIRVVGQADRHLEEVEIL